MRDAPVLITYGIDGLAHLVNETREDNRRATVKRMRPWAFQPGDIVRHQLFPEDRHMHGVIPIGVVVWCHEQEMHDKRAIGILWSGDPNQ